MALVSHFLSHFSPLQNQADLNLLSTCFVAHYHAVILPFTSGCMNESCSSYQTFGSFAQDSAVCYLRGMSLTLKSSACPW